MYPNYVSKFSNIGLQTCSGEQNQAFVVYFLGVTTRNLLHFYIRKNPSCWFLSEKTCRKDYNVLSGTVQFNPAKHAHAMRRKSD